MKKIILHILPAVLLACSCAGYYPAGEWRTSPPEAQGIDSGPLLQMLQDIKENNLEVDGIVIVRHGFLVLEAYNAPYDHGTIHNMKSVTKSILSALVGIACEEKALTLDMKISGIFPEWYDSDADPRKKTITLRHLLTMTAGIDWDENTPRSDGLWLSDNWARAAAETPLRDDPGSRFTYSTAVTQLASAAMTRRTGVDMKTYAREKLFDPIGVSLTTWRQDPQGIYIGGKDLFLTPLDMARFGFLFLRNGRWNGRVVVPPEWVSESTRAQVKTGGWGGTDGYGYWWWMFPSGYAARGWGGQLVYVSPGADLVAAFTCSGADDQTRGLLERYVLPAVKNGRLPANTAACDRIAALSENLENPAPQPPAAIPAEAASASGKSYSLGPNPLGFTGVRFDFTGTRECTMTLITDAGSRVLPVGLDGTFRISTSAVSAGGPSGACRGMWVETGAGGQALALELVDMVDPQRMEARISFQGERVRISLTEKSRGVSVLLEGEAAGR